MAVPTQQQIYRPLLDFVAQEQDNVVSIRQIRGKLTDHFSLDADELAETVPSGQNRFTNRIYWAVHTLKRHGLLDGTASDGFQVTRKGRQALATHKGDIYVSYTKGLIGEQSYTVLGDVEDTIEESTGVTPDEQMGELYGRLEEKLADEVLERVGRVHPGQFESLVVALLKKMGYGDGKVVGGSRDGGIDGIINQDQLGLEKVYVQAKRWQTPVGEPEIRNFSGSLSARGASKGVFITTSTFASNARETARNISAGNQFIRLIDGQELARLMIEFNVGVVTQKTYEVKKLDENFFSEGL